MRTEAQVIGVQEVHAVCGFIRENSAVVDTTAEHNVSLSAAAEELDSGKASASKFRVANLLDSLKRVDVVLIEVIIRNNQISAVRVTDKLNRRGGHVLLDVRGRNSGATVG